MRDFASPLGRTIGNCLSMSSCARIAGAIGVTMAKRMLLLGEVISAQEMMSRECCTTSSRPADWTPRSMRCVSVRCRMRR